MSKFTTIATAHGISLRPFKSGDKTGGVPEGAMRVFNSRENACVHMDKFWQAKGFKNMGAGR